MHINHQLNVTTEDDMRTEEIVVHVVLGQVKTEVHRTPHDKKNKNRENHDRALREWLELKLS